MDKLVSSIANRHLWACSLDWRLEQLAQKLSSCSRCRHTALLIKQKSGMEEKDARPAL
jgi:hypothetical protein